MATETIDDNYYINVQKLMGNNTDLSRPKCKLKKPKLKPTVIYDPVDGFIPIITWSTGK